MSNIASIRREDPDEIKSEIAHELSVLAGRAVAGEISAFSIVSFDPGGRLNLLTMRGFRTAPELVGALELLKSQIMKSWREQNE